MSLSLGQVLYAYSRHELPIDENVFWDNDTKEFIRTLKQNSPQSLQERDSFGGIPIEVISVDAFTSLYNSMIYTRLVNDKCMELQMALQLEDWRTLAETFPDTAGQIFRRASIKNPKDLVLEDITFYSFFPEWDRGFRGLRDDDLIVYFAPPKTGKCFGINTKVRMADGSIKSIQDIVVGDKVMGRDSKPRTVLHTHTGVDDRYKIHQSKACSYVTNSLHDLVLMKKFDNNRHLKGEQERFEEVIISSEELYERQVNSNNPRINRDYQGIKARVHYSRKDLNIHPYLFGLWLGDGRSDSMKITCHEDDFNQSYKNYFEEYDLKYKVYRYKKESPHILDIAVYGQRLGHCKNNKHIPEAYLRSDYVQRLALLAGIIDTDGYYNNKGTANNFEITTKSERLRDDYIELSNSLGFFTSYKEKQIKGKIYHTIYITGSIGEIPTKLHRKQAVDCKKKGSTIKIEKLSKGTYYGFECDGDHQFLLEDGTVVHNSTITAYFAYEAIKAGIPIGVYPTELTITTTLKYIFGYEFGLRGDESLAFFDGQINENGIIEGAHKEEFQELLEKYNHLIFMPPTNRFNWNDYEALYESEAKFIFHDNFIKSLSQLGLGEDATSASQFARKISDTQHKYCKCFAKDTPVLMADGSVKMIQDVHEGDLVMGKDSTSRKVLSSYNGVDTLYRVDQLRGMTYIVNSRHDLVLKEQVNNRDPHYKEVILTAKELFDYQQSVALDRKYQGISVSWDLPEANLPIDPYILGLWLGDGTSEASHLTTQDPEIRDIWISYGESLGLVSREYTKEGSKASTYRLSTGRKGKGVQNCLLNALRDLDLLNNKHIPDTYIRASRSQRLSLLAGLIDTDGYKVKGSKSRYTISTVREDLADTLEFLLNSLNLKVNRYFYKSTNENHSDVYELCFYGDLRECPIKLEYKQCTEFTESTNPIKVTKLEEGEFYGFECDGDHQFLLEDGTVVHNTTFLVTQEAMREATPKELESNPSQTEYGKGHTFLTRSLLQEASLALHIRRRPNTQTRDLIVKNDRFRGLNDGNSTMFTEVTNRGKIRVTMAKDNLREALIRAEKRLFEKNNMGEIV